jgi:hypothetical protein
MLAHPPQAILTDAAYLCCMGEIRTVTTLETKRTEIRNAIAEYERRLAQARADLAHVTACIRLFDTSDTTPCRIPAYADIHRLFKHRELGRLCHEALAKKGPQDTRELALYAMTAKGLDEGDSALISAVCFRAVQSLRAQERRGKLLRQGKRKGRVVWALPPLPLSPSKA